MSCVDSCLVFRGEARRLFLGLFFPEVLAQEESRSELRRSLAQHWPDQSPINPYELIFERWHNSSVPTSAPAPAPELSTTTTCPNVSTPEVPASETPLVPSQFLVFIDLDLDVDWLCENSLSKASEKCISTADSIGTQRCGHLPREQVLEFKRLIGQAIVNGIRGEADQACKLADDASRFLKDRTVERSRFWTLGSAHFLVSIMGTLAIYLLALLAANNFLSVTVNGMWLAMFGGLLGAYISVIQNAGNGQWDAAAGLFIHVLEVFTKFAAGSLFGLIAFAISQSVYAPASIKDITPDAYSMFLFGFAAGLFERLIPKLMSNYSKAYNSESDN